MGLGPTSTVTIWVRVKVRVRMMGVRTRIMGARARVTVREWVRVSFEVWSRHYLYVSLMMAKALRRDSIMCLRHRVLVCVCVFVCVWVCVGGGAYLCVCLCKSCVHTLRCGCAWWSCVMDAYRCVCVCVCVCARVCVRLELG